jgi:hypothetical protein
MELAKAHAVIIMPDGSTQRPVRGRSREELEAYCATSGATIVAIHPSLEEAEKAVDAMNEWAPDLPNWLLGK